MGWISKLLKINDEGYDENNIPSLIKKASNGDKDAQFDLAVKYANGDGVELNYQKAIELYEPLIKNDFMAAHNLALIYCAQLGEDKEYFDKGINLFIESAQKGFAPSSSELMKLLIIGFNVEQNHNGALYYLYQCIKSEYYKAIDDYYKAIGMVKNIGLNDKDAIHILESNSSKAISVERQIITDRTSSSLRWRIKKQTLLNVDNTYIDKIEVEYENEQETNTYYFDVSRAFEK